MCEAVAPDWSVRLSVRQVGPVVLRAGVATVHYLLAVLGPHPPTPLFGGAACTGTASTGMCVTGRRDLEQYERKIQGDHTHTPYWKRPTRNHTKGGVCYLEIVLQCWIGMAVSSV